jgi:hypothetical protein
LCATLAALPEYLFAVPSRHKSRNRRVHAIVLEDLHVFSSSIRASSSHTTPNALTTASTQLTDLLSKLTHTLSPNVIVTTSHSTTPSTFRPPIPATISATTTTVRWAVQRVPVVKFAPGMCVEEAENERAKREEMVSRGRFDVWRVDKKAAEGEGLVFRVGGSGGVEVEREMS